MPDPGFNFTCPAAPAFEASDAYLEVPLLIDATLPLAARGAPAAAARAEGRWRGLMGELGVKAVKGCSAPAVSPGALAGMDGALFGDLPAVFAGLLTLELPETVFGDRFGCATALAAAWLESGGRGVLASFGGLGGLPAIETLRFMLHVTGILPLDTADGGGPQVPGGDGTGGGGEGRGGTGPAIGGTGPALGGLRGLFEGMTGRVTANRRPVVGRGVFAVESGVHVDGLLKDPGLYEPFPPGLAGARRLLSVGLHSGRKSVALKCRNLGLRCGAPLAGRLLPLVRTLSLALGRGLADREFVALYREAAGGGACPVEGLAGGPPDVPCGVPCAGGDVESAGGPAGREGRP